MTFWWAKFFFDIFCRENLQFFYFDEFALAGRNGRVSQGRQISTQANVNEC